MNDELKGLWEDGIRRIATSDDFPYDNMTRVTKSNIAGNKNTPSDVLEYLSKNRFVDIRKRVARNPKTPHHVLEKLSEIGQDYSVRANVGMNIAAPQHILEKLKNDPDAYVRGAARRIGDP